MVDDDDNDGYHEDYDWDYGNNDVELWVCFGIREILGLSKSEQFNISDIVGYGWSSLMILMSPLSLALINPVVFVLYSLVK